MQVFADQYPYEASGTGIVGALIPRSAQVGGRDAMMKRITGELRPEIREPVEDNIARRGGADTFMISRYSANPSFEGQRLSNSRRRPRPPEEYALHCSRRAMRAWCRSTCPRATSRASCTSPGR